MTPVLFVSNVSLVISSRNCADWNIEVSAEKLSTPALPLQLRTDAVWQSEESTNLYYTSLYHREKKQVKFEAHECSQKFCF